MKEFALPHLCPPLTRHALATPFQLVSLSLAHAVYMPCCARVPRSSFLGQPSRILVNNGV